MLTAAWSGQFLASDLADSAIAGTGLPANVAGMKKGRIGARGGGAILCQLTAITDIGHSAFSLRNVRQTRIDKADMAGIAAEGQEEGGEVEDDGEDYTIPKYPRSMLRFCLSDGSNSIQAMEYRRIPALQLGETPLGIKVMLASSPCHRKYAQNQCWNRFF